MKSDEKKKLVMVFGTFDYLHAGHEHYISEARNLGNETIAIVARDKTVRAIKGADPDHGEKERLKNLETTGWVDKVILGDNRDKMKCIKNYRPDIIALGYDQFTFTFGLKKLIMDLKLNTEIIRMEPYKQDMYKSSILKRKKKDGQLKDADLKIPIVEEEA